MSYVEKALQRVNELIEQCEEGSEEHTDYVVMKQAIEKQIAKKSILIELEFEEKEYQCPTCGMRYWRKNGVKYCIDCGQKLD